MKYLLVLHMNEREEATGASPTPEQAAAMLEPWNLFGTELAEAGAFVAGEGLHPSSSATTVRHQENGDRIVSDGPFAETKEQIGGFYLLECADLDEVLTWAKKVPVAPGDTVEVRPVMDYGTGNSEDADAAAQAAG